MRARADKGSCRETVVEDRDVDPLLLDKTLLLVRGRATSFEAVVGIEAHSAGSLAAGVLPVALRKISEGASCVRSSSAHHRFHRAPLLEHEGLSPVTRSRRRTYRRGRPLGRYRRDRGQRANRRGRAHRGRRRCSTCHVHPWRWPWRWRRERCLGDRRRRWWCLLARPCGVDRRQHQECRVARLRGRPAAKHTRREHHHEHEREHASESAEHKPSCAEQYRDDASNNHSHTPYPVLITGLERQCTV